MLRAVLAKEVAQASFRELSLRNMKLPKVVDHKGK